jgi:DNA-binding Xre family transcriptional regulator
MARVVSHLRRLRMEYAARRGTTVALQEVVEATGLSRNRLTSLELGKFDRVANDELTTLCAYYSEALGRTVVISDILEIDTNNKRARDLASFAA